MLQRLGYGLPSVRIKSSLQDKNFRLGPEASGLM